MLDGKHAGCILKWGTPKSHQSRSPRERHNFWGGRWKYKPVFRFHMQTKPEVFSCRQEKSNTTSSFLKMTRWYCRVCSRALASAIAVVFAIYLIYLITYTADSAGGGAVGMRVTLSFQQCWLNGQRVKQRCDWQIATSFYGIDRERSILKRNIWSDSLTRNVSAVPASGTWEGEFLVSFSLGSFYEAVALEEQLRVKSERDLMDIALLNALPDSPYLSKIHITKVCSSSKLSNGHPRYWQSIANREHRERWRDVVTSIPDCIFTL